jgi:hypothetical protein
MHELFLREVLSTYEVGVASTGDEGEVEVGLVGGSLQLVSEC